jgi:dTDP-4-amino-4,6-dideoxygalactose transaminase
MWLRKRLDIGWSDLLWGLIWCGWPGGDSPRRPPWSAAESVLACTSVRSGFDLLWSAWDLPRESRVLFSALTVPDMARIVQHHGLEPVPVDLDPATMSPRLESVQRAMSPRVRAIVVAHLFGSRARLDALIRWAHDHDVKVIEDCAQAYHGPGYRGHPEADVSMFSFGQIKAGTALGGGLLFVRDRQLLGRMRQLAAGYPIQSRRSYLRRLLKCALLKAISPRIMFRTALACLRVGGIDYDRAINRTARGYSGSELIRQLRRRPSAPLLRMMSRRLSRYDAIDAARRAGRGRKLARWLAPGIVCPAAAIEPHTFWVFPILVDNPDAVIAALRHEGFDATQGHSMGVIATAADSADCDPVVTRELLAHLVYIPFYAAMPDVELNRMAGVLKRVAGSPVSSTPASSAAGAVGSGNSPLVERLA